MEILTDTKWPFFEKTRFAKSLFSKWSLPYVLRLFKQVYLSIADLPGLWFRAYEAHERYNGGFPYVFFGVLTRGQSS